MKKFALSLLLFFFSFTLLNAQNYSRVSLTPIFLKHSGGTLGLVNFSDSVTIMDRFDYNYFGDNTLSVPFPIESPFKKVVERLSAQLSELIKNKSGSDQIKSISKELDDAQEKLKYDDSMRNVLMLQTIKSSKIANKILASILIDPKLGYMTREVISKRGQYNASDADYLQAMNSELGEEQFKNIGKELLKNIYFVILDNSEQKSTALDKNNPNNLDISVYGQTYLFQIDIDSLMRNGEFNKLIFLTNNEEKARTFFNYDFPIKQILKSSAIGFATNYEVDAGESGKAALNSLLSGGSKDAKAAVKYIYKSDDEINKELANSVFSSSITAFIKKYKPFQVQVSVFATGPIRAKIGKKESLNYDDLYKVTENVLGKDGVAHEKKVGWLRVKKVSDNRKNADGKTIPSVFYKVGSKKVEKGMKLKERPEAGTIFGFVYNASGGNVMSGPLFTIDQVTHLYPGLRAGIGLGGFMPLQTSEVIEYEQPNISKSYKGINLYGEFTIQKIFQANRIEFTPYVGGYYSVLAITKYVDNFTNTEVDITKDEFEKGLKSETYGVLGGAKLGLNLGRNFQINAGYKLGFPIESGKLSSDYYKDGYPSEYLRVKFKNPATISFGVRIFGL